MQISPWDKSYWHITDASYIGLELAADGRVNYYDLADPEKLPSPNWWNFRIPVSRSLYDPAKSGLYRIRHCPLVGPPEDRELVPSEAVEYLHANGIGN